MTFSSEKRIIYPDENTVCVRNLPRDVFKKQIHDHFSSFGPIIGIHPKYRLSKDSDVMLTNPFAVIIFENSKSVDALMNARPLTWLDQNLFVRRFSEKERGRVSSQNNLAEKIVVTLEAFGDKIVLPGNSSVSDYLSQFGEVVELERIDDYHILVNFNDYDPVDVLTRVTKHKIDGQFVSIYSYHNEQEVLDKIKQRQKNYSNIEFDSNQKRSDIEVNFETFPEEKLKEIRIRYENEVENLNEKHREEVEKLRLDLENLMEERFRFEQLKIDSDYQRRIVAEEMKNFRISHNENFRERSQVEEEGKKRLIEVLQNQLKKIRNEKQNNAERKQ